MEIPDISTSSKEERLAFVKEQFTCLHNCEICGRCHILHGRDAEDAYKDYINGMKSFTQVSAELRG